MKQIIVNVSGLSAEEKQRVNEALAKITGVHKLPAINSSAAWFFAPASSGSAMVTWGPGFRIEEPTHTPQQVLEMAGMAKQCHVHADLMALYAEDAKTTDKPWELWEFLDLDGNWNTGRRNPIWAPSVEYRRKPKTHIVHGVEVLVFDYTPKAGDRYYVANVGLPEFFENGCRSQGDCTFTQRMIERGLLYPYTEDGKRSAILHAKAMLGIA